MGPSPAADATISDGQCRGVIERWQQPGDRPREKRLAHARRACHEQPVATGQRDLERPTRLCLSAHLGQVGDRIRGHESARSPRLGRGRSRDRDPRHRDGPATGPLPADDLGCLRERRRPDDLDAVDEPTLVDGRRGHDDTVDPTGGQGRDHRQDPRDRSDLAVQPQLPDQPDGDLGCTDLF